MTYCYKSLFISESNVLHGPFILPSRVVLIVLLPSGNMFPFMTAPRTKYYSAQLQSPLFRLPREVRNLIYDYYAQGKEGYIYDKETGKLLYVHPSAQTVGLGLMITCRIAAEEMQAVAFHDICFSTRCSVNDGSAFMGLRSIAGRLQCCKF